MSDDVLEESSIINLNEALIINSANSRVSQARNNANMVVRFYEKKKPNLSKSTEDEISYDKKIYTFIQRAGDKSTIIDRPMRETDKRTYPKQWRLFCEGKDQNAGTPLSLMMHAGLMDTAQYTVLVSLGIKNVEQLTNISVTMMDSIGPDAAQLQRLGKGFLAERAPKVQEDAMLDLKIEVQKLKEALSGGATEKVVPTKKVAAKKGKAVQPKKVAPVPTKPKTLQEEGFNIPDSTEEIELPQM